MRIRIIKIVFCITILISLFNVSGCKSLPDNNRDGIYIMVYDYENHALKDVKITFEDLVIYSDVYGRAVINLDKKTSGQIFFEKEGYKSVLMDIGYEKEQVLYIKLSSATYLAQKSEEKLDEGKLSEALELIEDALEIEKRKDYEYLKNIIEEKLQ